MVSFTSRCEQLQHIESKVLDSFERNVGWNAAESCSLMNNWQVFVHPQQVKDGEFCFLPSWWHEGMRVCVAGVTRYAHKSVELDTERYEANAYAHELAHVQIMMRVEIGDHCNWTSRGIKQAIFEVTGTLDDSVEDCP